MVFGGTKMDIERFTTYYKNKMKSNLTKAKRVKMVSEFFQKRENTNSISFKDENECFYYIIEYINAREEESEEILEEIYILLEYSYSTQNPYYVYDLKSDMEPSQFYTLVHKLLKKEFRYGDFEYKLNNQPKYDRINQIIEFELDYKEFYLDIVSDKEFRKSSGIIGITFDLKNNKFISSESTNYKNQNNIVKFLVEKGLNISSIYILKRALSIKNRNFSEFSPTTLLVINLLYEIIPKMGYELTLESISFTNLDSQNVQGMKMKGTDLLKAPEVLQRIHFGDEVHTLKLSLEIITGSGGAAQYFKTTFIMDLRGKLAFIFTEDDMRDSRKREICINLQTSLMELIYDEKTVERGQNIIHKELPKPKSLHQIVSDIQKDVLSLIKDTKDRLEVEKYFLERYPLSFRANQDGK